MTAAVFEALVVLLFRVGELLAENDELGLDELIDELDGLFGAEWNEACASIESTCLVILDCSGPESEMACEKGAFFKIQLFRCVQFKSFKIEFYKLFKYTIKRRWQREPFY